MSARRLLSAVELDAILRQRKASAEAATKGRAHRALPLDEVERREREKRVTWADTQAATTLLQRFPNCSGSCERGRSQCDCPTAGASAVSGIEDEPPYNVRPQRIAPRRPNYTWAAVVFFAVLCTIQWVRT